MSLLAFTRLKMQKSSCKIEGGFWYTLNDKGEYENSNIPVSGLAVAGSEADGWTLTVIDANGNKQEVKVPTAASLMSEFEIVGLLGDDNKISSDAVVLNYSANKVIANGKVLKVQLQKMTISLQQLKIKRLYWFVWLRHQLTLPASHLFW